MSWFKIDDGFHSHPKAIEAGNAALGLWVRCGSWSAANLTNGLIPHAIASLYGTKPQRNALVSSRLWVETEEGYQMHDYLALNPSRDQVLQQRKATVERVSKWRAEHARNGVGNGVTDGVVTPLVTPPPTRPDPTRPDTSSSRDSSTTRTGVPRGGGGGDVSQHPTAVRAIELYAETDMANRSTTAYANPGTYRAGIVRRARAEHWTDLLARLLAEPTSTAVDLAVSVLGLERWDAEVAESALRAREAS